MQDYKRDFPIFNNEKYKNMVYLDNAATTQRPNVFLHQGLH